ncbi:hypothetical protein [Millisia brevis]|uniref:hypothetical protein n=1 Tax=Millisia brevis TaxID=264148 RepID=UPI00082EF941|nr:hypothetical protein [Millisia brevis]
MPQESSVTDRYVRYERASLRIAAVVVLVSSVTLILAALSFDSFFKGFIQGAAGVLALIAISLAIPAIHRRIIPMDAMLRQPSEIRRREAGIGLGVVTVGLVVSVLAYLRVPAMSGFGGAMLALGALAVVGAGIIVLAVVPADGGEQPAPIEDEQMWLPSRDGDV